MRFTNLPILGHLKAQGFLLPLEVPNFTERTLLWLQPFFGTPDHEPGDQLISRSASLYTSHDLGLAQWLGDLLPTVSLIRAIGNFP